MVFLKVLFAIIFALTAAYVVFSATILVLSLWLKNKMRDNPTGNIEDYRDCPWYIAPKTSSELIARKLADRGFVQYFSDFVGTCILVLVCAVVVMLFVIYVINSY